MDEELRFHLEARADDLARAGMRRGELRPLPYRDPARLVMVYSVGSFGPFSWRDGALADPDYLELRTLSAFSQLAAFTSFEASLTGAGDPLRALESSVTTSFFPLLGVEPALGRRFREGEEAAREESVAALSDALWRSRFRTDPVVIGRVENVDGVPHTIVGVMPVDPAVALRYH
jgi:hypothetical protein